MRVLSLSASILLVSSSIALGCGTERWAVKTGSDRDAGKVELVPQDTTVASMIELHAPNHPNSRASSRFPDELKTFRIRGVLTVIKKEGDEDYHLVISDPEDEEATMIVESVSPDCTDGSLFTEEIEKVRSALDKQFKSLKKKQRPNIPVVVTGVAFFDPIHGQEGVAPNGVELHPILDIQFESGNLEVKARGRN